MNKSKAQSSPTNQNEARELIQYILNKPSSADSEIQKWVISALEAVESGEDIEYFKSEEEISPSKAAEILNVSRPYVDKLIKLRKLPCHNVPGSSHRKLWKKDVIDFKDAHKKSAREALKELSKLSQDMGLDD